MAERIDVFISSTSRDLATYREAITKVIIRLGMYPIGMEGFNPTGNNALQLCYDKVQEAEVFIGIYAHRYGYAPGEDVTYTTIDGKSLAGDGETGITHLEYQWALARDLPMLLFVVKDDTPWNPNDIEDEPGRSRLNTFKDMILGKHVVGFFSSPDNLASQVATGLAEIKSQLEPEADKPFGLPRRRDFYKQIQLPPNYVPRQELIEELRLALLGEEDEEAKGTLAFHGMGGIGKSVMARALCDDPAVHAAFPDGILWTSLGQTPNLVAKLREWVEALGGTISETAPTVDSLKATLAELLENRTCLLILDDVWQKNHAEAFRVVTENSRLLMTTRDAEIPRGMGADVHPIPSMSLPEAIHMLEEWADGNLANADESIKTTIVEKLGRLPLAIKLAGAQLQKKSPEKWLERFDARKLKSKRAETVHDSLEQTFGLSLETLDETERKLYAALAIFKEDEPIHEVAIARLWDALDEFDEDDTEELLDDLASRALLEVAGDEYPRAAVLHDLLRDFLMGDLGDKQQNTHQALVKAYQQTQTDDGWHTAPDDGYLYDHLTYHLREAGQLDDLKGLFENQDWLYARVPNDGYSYAGYRADIDDAWGIAESAAYAQIEDGEFPDTFVNCLRYALIYTSINSLSGNYVPALVAEALKTNLPNWSVERALNIAEQIPDLSQKIKMYIAIIETGQIPLNQLASIQRKVLTVAQSINLESYYADAVSALAPQLQGDLLHEALTAAVNFTHESYRSDAVSALAPQLQGDLLHEALAAAQSITFISYRTLALSALAPHLERDLLRKVLIIAQELAYEGPRARILSALAPHLDGDLLHEALTAARSISSESRRARVLSALAPHLDGDLLHEALTAAQELADESSRIYALIALAPQLEGDHRHAALSEAFNAAQSITDETPRARALRVLAPQLEENQRHTALREAFAAAQNINSESYRSDAVSALAPQLKGDLLHEALTAAQNINSESCRARVLSALAPQMDGALLSEALTAAQDITHDFYRIDVLIALATQLEGDQRSSALSEALTAAHNITDESNRAQALRALAPLLNVNEQHAVLREVLNIAQHIASKGSRADALSALAPHLEGDLLRQALATAHNITDKSYRALALCALAYQLDGEQRSIVLRQALVATRDINYEFYRARVVRALAPQLEGDLLSEALTIARNITDESYRVDALSALAHRLQGDQQINVLREALTIARNLTYEDSQVDALSVLASQLEGDLLSKALTAAKSITNELYRVRALSALTPQLDSDQQLNVLREALTAAKNIEGESSRASALHVLSPLLKGDLLSEALTSALNIRAESSRVYALITLASRLEDEQQGNDLRKEITVALRITDESYRVDALHVLSPLLKGDLLSEALTSALNIRAESYRVDALRILAPQLEGDLLSEALNTALDIQGGSYRASALANLIPHILEQQEIILQAIYQAVVSYLQTAKTEQRSSILEFVAIEKLFAPPIFSQETLWEIAETIIEICNEWDWL